MDRDDDVEHLFSWLQTPHLRYREFAGAREVTDAVATSQILRNASNGHAAEPEPAAAAPDGEDSAEAYYEAPYEAPAPPPELPPGPPLRAPNVFSLGAGGRGGIPPAGAAPQHPAAAPRIPPAGLVQPNGAPPRAEQPPLGAARMNGTHPAPAKSPSGQPPSGAMPGPAQGRGGHLLGGAYRAEAEGSEADGAAERRQRDARSLDAVFSRLAGGDRQGDAQSRLRHIPGFGPSAGRSR